MKRLLVLGLGVMLLLVPSAKAEYEYALDNGLNSGHIEWYLDHYFASLQVFPTDTSNNIIDGLKVAWGNQTGDSQVVLYSLDNGYQLPHMSPQNPANPPVDTSKVHVLQVVDTTVTAGQTNPLVWNPPSPSSATWTTYDITATAITTDFFAVGTIQRVPNPASSSSNIMDIQTDLAVDGSNGYSWLGTINGTEPLLPDLSNAGFTPDDYRVGWVNDWSGYGYGNNPYLIRALTIPEPSTCILLLLGAGFFACTPRRRN